MAEIVLLRGMFLLTCAVAAGQPTEFLYKELNLIGGYSDNDGLIGKNRYMLKNSAGFEYFRKFSDQYGDHLTLDLQVRYSMILWKTVRRRTPSKFTMPGSNTNLDWANHL